MSTGNLSEAPALPWPLEHLFGWRARVVRDLFAALAGQHGARYVNLFTAPGDPNPFLESPRTYYARDFLHPSGAGYGVWYPKLRAQVPLHDWLGGT